jgi:hypothetical protein
MSATNGASDDPFGLEQLTTIEFPFHFQGKDYLLKEATADAVRKYHNFLVSNAKPNAEGKPTSLENYADVDTMLVADCVFEKGVAEPVALTLIRSWPDRVVSKLLAKIKQVSPSLADKKEPGETSAKN